ncbi:hypothetical protein NMY22_g10879 [Coprinellus aureogranulatus]|nr:hypothetical protein NMY22_g10879 [Coprinellus aureogranulatus]
MERARGAPCGGIRKRKASGGKGHGKVEGDVQGATDGDNGVDLREEKEEVGESVLGEEEGKDSEDGEEEDEEMKVEEFAMEAQDVQEDEEMDKGEDGWETEGEDETKEHADMEEEFCGCPLCKAKTVAPPSEYDDDDDDDWDNSDYEESLSDLEDEDELDLEDSTTLGASLPACTSSSSPSDVIITGSMDERHAEAWGNFAYYGRVRPWDGLIGILRVGTREEHVGSKFFFYGYVYGGRNFVGNWRFAGTDAVSAGMESSFVLTRRGE